LLAGFLLTLGTRCRKKEVADLTGRSVEVPGPVFHEPSPDAFFRCGVPGQSCAVDGRVMGAHCTHMRMRVRMHTYT